MNRSNIPAFNLGGVPLNIHWSVLLLFPVFWAIEKQFLGVLVGVLAYLFVLAVHEAGHASVARLLNLRVHSITIWPLHGQCRVQLPPNRKQHIAVAWGGVGAQMLLALAAFAVAAVLSLMHVRVVGWLQPAFVVFEIFNPIIALFNLIPVAPLDGPVAWGLRPYAPTRT